MLASEGICGHPRLADVGGVPNLIPLPQKDKIYNLETIAKQVELPNAFIIGAGAGPSHFVGVNCELMPNINIGDNQNNTHFATVAEDGKCHLEKLRDSTDFRLLANLFASEGQQGKVICIHVKKRTGPDNFVTAIRKILLNNYKDQPVGVGGSFLIKNGKAKIHVMPHFSETPLKTDEDVNNWLKFYNMSAPLVCLSVFVSHDPDLDLRVEHTHCFSNHGEGGHYHTDTTPDDVEYLGYFNIAEYMFRIDPPTETHLIGRD
ncbi:ester hydrolase C11orf54 homolog isoform X2 [Limulus polyphemus]|nr:ester hydrolase C11orf54 homolog isoform X2 [Limulus polyphemus]